MQQDIFRDTPAYQHILEMGRQEGIVDGEKVGIEKGFEQANKKFVQSLRSRVVTLAQQRFPKLRSLATREVALIESHDILQDLFIKITLAQTMEEALKYLAMWDQTDEVAIDS